MALAVKRSVNRSGGVKSGKIACVWDVANGMSLAASPTATRQEPPPKSPRVLVGHTCAEPGRFFAFGYN